VADAFLLPHVKMRAKLNSLPRVNVRAWVVGFGGRSSFAGGDCEELSGQGLDRRRHPVDLLDETAHTGKAAYSIPAYSDRQPGKSRTR
jgi:hypothetical protein